MKDRALALGDKLYSKTNAYQLTARLGAGGMSTVILTVLAMLTEMSPPQTGIISWLSLVAKAI